MRLVDFLIFLLEAHAESLTRLAALLGEDVLTELLEAAGDSRAPTERKLLLDQEPQYFGKSGGRGSGSAYAELESTVRGLNLPPFLEFHLWAYPYYRQYIESSLDLDASLSSQGSQGLARLADEAILDAKAWTRSLPLPPELGKQAEKAAEVPWVKFRAALLKKSGHRPLGPVFSILLIVAALSGAPARGFCAEKSVPLDGDRSLELHAHLFMKEGMNLFFRGGFNDPIQARSWKDRFHSQANAETLERSGIGLVVATLYAHPLMTWSLKDSIRRQIAQAEEWVSVHRGWMIAGNSDEARAALHAKKKVIVLALEGASGILESEEDFQEFLDRKKIRIVTPLHLTDDHFGSVALLRGYWGLSSPWAWFRAVFSQPDAAGVYFNSGGLTEDGRKLAHALIRHRVWIDLPHASDRAQLELIEIMKKAGQPLLYTHTVLRKYHGAERGISEAQLHHVAQTDGVIGLMPSHQMLEGTPGDSCHGDMARLVRQYREISEIVPSDAIGFGTDFNGGLSRLDPWTPECNPGSETEKSGFTHIGQTSEVWKTLSRLGARVPHPLSRTIDHFLKAWKRVETNN